MKSRKQIGGYYEQLYETKLEDLESMDKILDYKSTTSKTSK